MDASGTKRRDLPDPVTSGFGCDAHNKRESKVENGLHTQAVAAEISKYSTRSLEMLGKSLQIGFSGIGVSQKGPHHKRFVHVDTLERKALWSY